MKIEVQSIENKPLAIVSSDEALLTDVQSALDLIANVQYQTGLDIRAIVLPKQAVAEDFFVLRTRLAGEILQKFVNYRMKLAIVGDFSGYTSKSLADFIWESNRGRDIFFAETEQEALAFLRGALT